MANYRTPGVYVKEVSTLPPSVAEVSTAVPAFIGYTSKCPTRDDTSDSITPVIRRISTLLDYIALFGGANPSEFDVTTRTNADGVTQIASTTRDISNKHSLYYSLCFYFKNGGGSCYIVSVGNYTVLPTTTHFNDGLAALEKEDEPTLIVLTDAVALLGAVEYTALCVDALAQCKKLGDRFAILDVGKAGPPKTDEEQLSDVGYFRNNTGTKDLIYGAAYYPFVETSLSFDYEESGVSIKSGGTIGDSNSSHNWQKTFGTNGILVTYYGPGGNTTGGGTPGVNVLQGETADNSFDITSKILTITLGTTTATRKGDGIAQDWIDWKQNNGTVAEGFEIVANGTGNSKPPTTTEATELDIQSTPQTESSDKKLSDLKSSNTALYNQIKTALAQQRITLPPSPAIAGVYASVDKDRGVWKAPANISLSSVIGPVTKISQEDQDQLNVDENGKSINAIRAFTGKGTLVWGARTLAGNDNEWRYVSVRRLFNMIEESTQKATSFAVFEPNDATTWLKVKAMIESYLYGLWQQGALAGLTPEDAYFVEVGLGKTMRTEDILEGRMIVNIGVAAVRPAEFIILTFMHKLQQAA